MNSKNKIFCRNRIECSAWHFIEDPAERQIACRSCWKARQKNVTDHITKEKKKNYIEKN